MTLGRKKEQIPLTQGVLSLSGCLEALVYLLISVIHGVLLLRRQICPRRHLSQWQEPLKCLWVWMHHDHHHQSRTFLFNHILGEKIAECSSVLTDVILTLILISLHNRTESRCSSHKGCGRSNSPCFHHLGKSLSVCLLLCNNILVQHSQLISLSVS